MNDEYNYNVLTVLTPKLITDILDTPGINIIIIKFGASWCGPCKKISPVYKQFIQDINRNNNINNNIVFADIDIDTDINNELYSTLKRLKMIKGVPTIMAFYKNKNREHWYVPDDTVNGYNIEHLTAFFNRCIRQNNLLAKINNKNNVL